MTDNVNYYTERLANSLADVDEVIRNYWFAAPENDTHQPLDFDWNLYLKMEAMSMLKVFTARKDNGHMIGCCLYNVTDHPHHKGYTIAECDTLGVAYEARGRGVGAGLVTYAEPVLKQLGVKEIVHRARLVYNTEHLFPKLGFTAIETSYSKKVT